MGNADALIYFPCCGNGYCKKCDENNYKDVSKTGEYRGKDPRKIQDCRTKLTHTDAEQNKQIEKLAKKGVAWAQNSMGKFYYRGMEEGEFGKGFQVVPVSIRSRLPTFHELAG